MRFVAASMCVLLAGCAPLVSSEKAKPGGGAVAASGVAYDLPKGLVPVFLYVDKDGIGVSIFDSLTVGDSAVGKIHAKINASPVNKDEVKISTTNKEVSKGDDKEINRGPSFLSSVTTNSESQIVAIAEELGKSIGRMKLQNAVVDFRNTVRPEYEDYFDPYSEADIARVNAALNAAVGRGFEALNAVGSTRRMRSGTLAITVHYPDGSKPKAQQPSESDLEACKQGICARARDSLIIRLLLDGQVLGSKVVHPPSPGVMALPLPGSVSNQDIAIALNEGVVEKYDFKRDSALLQLVKLPGALISGVAKGLTQGLTDEKTALEAKKDLLTLEREMAAADKAESENNENGNPGSTPSADNANDQGRTSPANPGSDGESLHSAEASGGGVDGVPMGGGAGGAAPGNSSPIDLSQSPGTGVSAGPANALTIRPFSLDVPGFPVAVEAGQPQTQQGK